MKKLAVLFLLVMSSFTSFAGHIAGGEMYYTYVGPGSEANTRKYKITLRLFRECHPLGTAAELPTDVEIGLFRIGAPSVLMQTFDIPRTSFNVISLQKTLSCIINPPEICYQVAEYTFMQDLADDSIGYTFAYQTCCRSNSIINVQFYLIQDGQNPGEGATYSCDIPSKLTLGGSANSSAVFNIKDTVLICKSKNIYLDFSATDPDGDSLSYQFCAAYNRGNSTDSRNVVPSNPPYQNVTYTADYSGSEPMGGSIKINPATGIITGMAPLVGAYVINVCVSEWRNGKIISVHRKDFMVRVADCDFAAAVLDPSYITCDGFTLAFQNKSTSAGINSYYWEFGDTASATNNSSDPTPAHTYGDTGTYSVKLVVNRGEECTDSTIAQALVYPGFFPDFKITGSCSVNPYLFTDLTTSKYGKVNSWHWDFGDLATTADTSTIQNPTYQYPSPQTDSVHLIVTNSKGCLDTVTKSITVSDKPTINLPFHDTLICVIDTLQLQASSGTPAATFSWSPLVNISNPNIANPIVSPKTTITYLVTVNDKGCINTDSLTVNVIPNVQLFAGNDTTICLGDAMLLQPVTNALYFSWTPAETLDDASARSPLATPVTATKYQVTASVGKCAATDAVNVRVVPYPVSVAGPDATVCFGNTTQLQGSITGASFSWYPLNSLINANTLAPTAGPQYTTSYILTVTDNQGCPKPVSDTVIVNVIPHIRAYAGHDTTVVINQPLQLNASGGDIYAWSPSTGMDNPNIPNPIVTLNGDIDTITYQVKVSITEGCFAYDDVKVTIFKTQPDIFVPTGFTPNGDGKNDVLTPKVVGLKQFNYFKVFDRWGVMVFSTTQIGKGWDGTYSGAAQGSGTYVFVAQGVDYTGKALTKKGTVVLIR